MIEPKDRFVTIRMPIEIFKVVKAQADSQTRSISRQIVHLIKTALESEKWPKTSYLAFGTTAWRAPRPKALHTELGARGGMQRSSQLNATALAQKDAIYMTSAWRERRHD